MGKNTTTHDDDNHDHEQAEGGAAAAAAGDRLSLPPNNHGPSCMWGILHHFQHNRWLHAKKLRLTTPKHHHHHHHLDQGKSTKTDSVHSTVETKSSSKNSMKSRLKSLITEEIMSKRKGGGGRRHHNHQRSTSYPTRAPPDDATPTPESSTTTMTNTSSPCEMCTTMLDLNNNNNMMMMNMAPRQIPIERDHQRDFVQESKLFMNALDLLNLRKEVFLKILHDPNSSLAHQLPRSNPNAITKSVSFPASSSSSPITDHNFDNNNNNKHAVAAEELELDLPVDNNKNNKRRSDNNNNSKIIVLKRFKNLREKIKHVIRDRKKEKNRIIMDAVHHKIPYGHHNNINNKARDYGKFGGGKQQSHHHKRTSSFDESYTRYSRLLDTINSDVDTTTAKHHPAAAAPPPTSINTTSVFKRILSLPDLRAYSSIHTDDNNYNNSNIDDNDVTSAATDDKNIVNDKPRAYGMSSSLDNLFDVRSTFDDSVDSKTWETASSNDLDPPDPTPHDHIDSDYQDDDEDSKNPMDNMATDQHISDTIDGLEPLEIEKLYADLLQLHMGSKNEAEFNYVKDVLELSGFTRDELLGAWHSAERPVDPSVFDEVEGSAAGSLFANPENVDQGGGPYDQLLLFDLINEVLLDIHERSFCYWPVPLTVRSRIHQMPKGYRVLEEVWAEISWLLSWRPEADQSIDDVVGRDLAKHDRWMSLQMDAEFVGLEIEDMIFDDLLDDIVSI